MQSEYYSKYLKYKEKYLEIKKNNTLMSGGGNKPTLYLFKADWCGHCNNFKSTWVDLKKSMKNNVNFVTYDADKHSNQIQQWNVQGFPTLILQKNDKAIEYTGSRDLNSLSEFIKN